MIYSVSLSISSTHIYGLRLYQIEAFLRCGRRTIRIEDEPIAYSILCQQGDDKLNVFNLLFNISQETWQLRGKRIGLWRWHVHYKGRIAV